MIKNNLTNEQLQFLLKSISNKSHDIMREVEDYISTACMTCETLWCKELFDLLELDCPEELKPYGWKEPRKYLDRGYFYMYIGLIDDIWCIEFPDPERVEI